MTSTTTKVSSPITIPNTTTPTTPSPSNNSPLNALITATTTPILAAAFATTPPKSPSQAMLTLQAARKMKSEVEILLQWGQSGDAEITHVEKKAIFAEKIAGMREKLKEGDTHLTIVRTDLVKLTRINEEYYEDEKIEILDLLLEVILNDPITKKSAAGIPKMVTDLHANITKDKLQHIHSDLQRKMTRVCAAASELLLHHYKVKTYDAVTEELKKGLLEVPNSYEDLHTQEEPATEFVLQLLLEADKRFKTDIKFVLDFIERASHFTVALVKAFDKDLATFISEMKSAFQGLGDKWNEEWFQVLFEVRLQIQKKLNEKKPIKEIITTIQTILKAKDVKVDWKFTYGVLEILGRVVSKTNDVRILEIALFGQTIPSKPKPIKLPGIDKLVNFKGFSKKAKVKITESDTKADKAISAKAQELEKILLEKLSSTEDGKKALNCHDEAKRKGKAAIISSARHSRTPSSTAITAPTPSKEIPGEIVSAFFKAVASGENKIVREMLTQDGNLAGKKDHNNDTAIIVAAKNGRFETCEILLRNHCWPALTGNKTRNALHHAAAGGFTRIVQLFTSGAKPILLDAEDEDHNTPLMLASENGHHEVCEMLLIDNKASYKTKKPTETNLIHIAAKNGRDKVIASLTKILIKTNAMGIDCRDNENNTPFLLAARAGHTTTCDLLRKEGAERDAKNAADCNALHLAVEGKHFQTITTLSNFSELVNAKNKKGKTPLLIAVESERKDICDHLWKVAQANPWITNNEGLNSLQLAATQGSDEIVRLFAEDQKLLESTTKNGHTALTLAAKNNKIGTWEILVTAKANPRAILIDESIVDIYRKFIRQRSSINSSPLMIAASLGETEMCKILLDAGEKPSTPNDEGWNAAHFAAFAGHTEVMHKLLENDNSLKDCKLPITNTTLLMLAIEDIETFKVILKFNPDLQAVDKSKWSVLHHAANKGKDSIIRLLSPSKDDLNKLNDTEASPLMLATQGDHDTTCALLMQNGASQNLGEVHGSVMHYACRLKKLKIVEMLLKQYPGLIDARNSIGSTPFMFPLNIDKEQAAEEQIFSLLLPFSNLNLTDDYGNNILHWLCQEGKLKLVKKVLERNKELVKVKNMKTDKTPLMIATEKATEAAEKEAKKDFDDICAELKATGAPA